MDQIDKLILDDGARYGAFRVIQNANTAYDSSRKRVAEGTYYTDHDAAVAACEPPGRRFFRALGIGGTAAAAAPPRGSKPVEAA